MLAEPATLAYKAFMIDAAQMRAARALIGWRMEDLAERAGVSLASIKNIERGATDPRASTLRAIQAALEDGGVVFVDDGDTRPAGRGVRFAQPTPSTPKR